MASSRPYRKPIELEAILKEIAEESGKQFAPPVVRVFLSERLYENLD